MIKYRFVFEKLGTAKYISHLDLMRTLQRAFTRAELPVRYSEGFNPHIKMSIVLPLSVGAESVCELVDFETETELDEGAAAAVNAALPEGIRVLRLLENTRKGAEAAWIRCLLTLYYDSGTPEGAEARAEALFTGDSLVVRKRTKSGESDFDLIPCIDAVSVSRAGEDRLLVHALVSAQNPVLNPMLLADALRLRLPELAPDFAEFKRLELLDGDMRPFLE